MIWRKLHQGDRMCVPGTEGRYLVAQDDGYIEMAEWTGGEFVADYPPTPYGPPRPPLARVRYWSELPEVPTEDGGAPF